MLDMFRIADNQGIVIKWWDFEPPVLGLYWDPGDVRPLIALDNSLEYNTPLARTVMAEELGHHFTTPLNALTRTYFHYRDRLNVSRAEYRAQRWAALYLMPEARLTKVIQKGCRESWELAEVFDITERMVRFRLGLI